ncbi:hypothetical protein QAD02_007633 [Eretmocerus hayati]|uniref:Uncharacterized protein n=1 Tax=Eretmocerus hayati TaxID=131215 RepID=A0ACC2N4Z9_9HYME|nr:hypothetical protein QAD02_007633 [Eretmocerus hayati]
MPIDVKVYRASCQEYEETLHPFDGDVLVDYVQGFVKLEEEALRLRDDSLGKKMGSEQERSDQAEDDDAGRRASGVEKPRAEESTPIAALKNSSQQQTASPQVEDLVSTTSNNTAVEGVETVVASSATIQQPIIVASTSDHSAPIRLLTSDIDRAATSTPLAIAAGPSLNLDLSRFPEDLSSLPSPVAMLRPHEISQSHHTLSPLGLMDLDDAVNDPPQIPPSSATPEHLRSTATIKAASSTLRAHMLSPVSNAPNQSIRVRILRGHLDTAPTAEQQPLWTGEVYV